MATHDQINFLYHNPQMPLRSKLLSPQGQLQAAARKGSKKYVKRSHQGPHVSALQQSLNRLRTAGYGWVYPTGAKVFPSWRVVSVKGEFDQHTYAALKGFQDWANRFNRANAHHVGVTYGGAPGTRAYKKEYYSVRERIKPDGIAGPVTLNALDETLRTFTRQEKREGKR